MNSTHFSQGVDAVVIRSVIISAPHVDLREDLSADTLRLSCHHVDGLLLLRLQNVAVSKYVELTILITLSCFCNET